jgi:hypothetical protein
LFVSAVTTSELRINADPSYFTSLAFVRKLIIREQDVASKKGYNLCKLLTSSNLDLENEETVTDEVQKSEPVLQVPQVYLFFCNPYYFNQ